MKRIALFIGGALVLIILAVSALAGGPKKDHPAAQDSSFKPGPKVTATATGAPVSEVNTPSAPGQSGKDGAPVSLNPVDAAQVATLARKFVVGYQQRSYADGGPTAWLKNVRPLTTSDFYGQIVNQANSDGTNWDEFVKSKAVIAVKAKPGLPLAAQGNTYVGVPFEQTYSQSGEKPTTNPGFLTVFVMKLAVNGKHVWLVSGTSIKPPDSTGN